MAQGIETPAATVAEVLDAALCANAGMHSEKHAARRAKIAWQCYSRLRARYEGVVAALVPVQTAALERSWEDIAYRAQAAITDRKLVRASPRDLAVIAGIATDKRAILRGEPSAIVGHTHEAAGSLDRLCEAIVAERERRSTLPVVVETVHNHEIDVTPRK